MYRLLLQTSRMNWPTGQSYSYILSEKWQQQQDALSNVSHFWIWMSFLFPVWYFFLGDFLGDASVCFCKPQSTVCRTFFCIQQHLRRRKKKNKMLVTVTRMASHIKAYYYLLTSLIFRVTLKPVMVLFHKTFISFLQWKLTVWSGNHILSLTVIAASSGSLMSVHI